MLQLARYSNGLLGSLLLPSRRPVSPPVVGNQLSISQLRFICANSPVELRYRRSYLDNVEDIEKYRRGGFHPIHLGDYLKGGRYCILHKLGYGGFSTVWLARDEHEDKLVSLKVMTAEASQQRNELRLLRYLDEHVQADSRRGSIITALDDFIIDGPNGTHLCYVSQPGGPNLFAISDSPGEIAGTRRLRAPLARKISQQLAKAVSMMHDVGIVHGDITPRNVLLQLKGINTWPAETIYQQLGRPVRDKVFTSSGQKPSLSAPEYLVESASFSRIDSDHISEQALLIDLGEAFSEVSPPTNGVGTPVSYCSPELLLARKASRASDVWALACTIFEIRSGFPLFESFVGSSTGVLKEMVRILGIPPEPSHSLWTKQGIAISDLTHIDGPTLDDLVKEIGMDDEASSILNGGSLSTDYHALLEPSGKRITGDEESALTDLLGGVLNYAPENRLSAEEVAHHPWFSSGVND